jgi:molecular chaperone HscA
MQGELGDRTLYMIIDIGAGTSDLCVMALGRQFGEIRPITIPGGALSIEWAGDHLDDLLVEHLLETQAPDEGARLSRIKRDLKERLFRDHVIDLELGDVSLYLELKQFLVTEQWERFQNRLREAQGRCIDQIDPGYWKSWGNSAVRIVITGGGAYLPLEKLKTGRLGERNVACQKVEGFPEALRFKYQEMSAELPRLVVAIGGASDELPEPLDRKHVPRDPHPVAPRHIEPLDKTATGFEERTINL